MSDKIVNFPNSNEQNQHEEHRCDSCVSAYIHELSHQFEEVDPEDIISECMDAIFEALENDEDGRVIVDAVFELFKKSYDVGYNEHIKQQIHELSGDLMMRTNVVSNGEEQ